MMRIGELQMETDPVSALKALEVARQRLDALPTGEQQNATPMHLRSLTLHRVAIAWNELGEYSKAAAIYDDLVRADRARMAQDPVNVALQEDLESDLVDQATGYQYAADPVLAAHPDDLQARRRNLTAALNLELQALEIVRLALQRNPGSVIWKLERAMQQMEVGSLRASLGSEQQGARLVREAMSVLRASAKSDDINMQQCIANEFLEAEPASLRDPAHALIYAQNTVNFSHGKTPSMLLTLSQAYRAAGQTDKSRATANEALALLPPAPTSGPKSRIRKLLEIEVQTVQ
jgi:tetratricopeptide (TPR) repeat protein